jgi:amino acid transporter
MAYVAAEVKNAQRNIVRALVLGTVSVIVLYLLVNGAFLYTLGYRGMAASEAVAVDSISTLFPQTGGRLISALVCISALGAVNGLIFTGARISYALGSEHRLFGILGRWHRLTGTPAWALLVQGAIAVTLILVFGSFVDTILYTAPAVYAFYLATSLSVIVLRRKEPNVERPYRVTGYPITTIIFCVICALLIYSALTYAIATRWVSIVILLSTLSAGLLVYRLETSARI